MLWELLIKAEHIKVTLNFCSDPAKVIMLQFRQPELIESC